MPVITVERCNGCGVCLEACPTGAMRLADDRAVIAESLCQHCGRCITVCPLQAIAWKPDEHAPEIELARAAPITLAQHQRPSQWRLFTGAMLSLLGREVLPRAIEWLLGRWDQGQRASMHSPPVPDKPEPHQEETYISSGGAQQRHRHRHGAT